MLRPLALAGTLLALLSTASPLEAQRRGRGRTRRPTPEAPATPAETPDNPFAEPAATTTAPAATTAPATPPSTPPSTPPAASTAPAASATPPAASTAPAAPDPGPAPPDVAPVRADLGHLMDDMVQARQRMAVLGEELFRTRIRIAVQDRAGDDQSLAHFVVELDGAPVFRSDAEIEGGDRGRTVHEGALAPGPHVLTIETEQRSRDDAEVRYSQRETFRVQVHRERLTDIEIVLEDDSSMVEAFHQRVVGRHAIPARYPLAPRDPLATSAVERGGR